MGLGSAEYTLRRWAIFRRFLLDFHIDIRLSARFRTSRRRSSFRSLHDSFREE